MAGSDVEYGIRPAQEPKYTTDANGRLVNRASGQPIPDDEPVFIFRARDIRAVGVLKRYLVSCTDAEHRQAVAMRIADFERFAREHYTRMKEPDTELPR